MCIYMILLRSLLSLALTALPITALAATPTAPRAPRPCPKEMQDLLPSTAVADGAPCCYKADDGNSYSSVYENGSCKKDTALVCFVPRQAPLLDADEPRLVA